MDTSAVNTTRNEDRFLCNSNASQTDMVSIFCDMMDKYNAMFTLNEPSTSVVMMKKKVDDQVEDTPKNMSN